MSIQTVTIQEGPYAVVAHTDYDYAPHDHEKPYKIDIEIKLLDVVLVTDTIGGLDDPDDTDHLTYMALDTARGGLLTQAGWKVIEMYDAIQAKAP